MKTILAYGDSLTWGSNPAGGTRHPEAVRWPNVLEKTLDGRARVITDALRGRTTAYDEYLADCDRNGVRTLPTTLYTHAPLDLVVVMLGSNDMKPHIAGTAIAALQGMRRLVSIVRNHNPGLPGLEVPEILVVSPPPLCETADPFFSAMLAGGVEQSGMLASHYSDLADELGCGFFDAASVARTAPADGIHLDAENTVALGKALAPIVHVMLGL